MDDVSEYCYGDEDELSEHGCESFPFAFTTRELQTRQLTNILKVEDEDVVCGRGTIKGKQRE